MGEYNVLYDKVKNDKNDTIVTKTYLSNLIINLTTDIKNGTCNHIKYPAKLLQSLHKLNNIVGMHKLKESIAQQTSFLITKMKNGNFSLKMLNTCLFGGPGQGKSTIGIIMAEIWKHLGILQINVDNNTTILSKIKDYDINVLYLTGLTLYVLLNKMYQEFLKPLYYSNNYIILFFSIIILFLILIYYYDTNNYDDNVVTIANRTDFVDIYLGGTAPKTKKFIEANRGKVIFLDETYNLVNAPNDTYGLEALNTINQWMSENPNEVVFIFAGYEHLMKNTIFKAQPGLERRCMWHFNCDKYSGKELYEILLQQLKKEDLELSPRDSNKVCNYIEKHVEDFKNQGGDMERLTFYLQLIQSRKDNVSYITYDDVKNAVKDLNDNSIKVDNKVDKIDFNKLFNI